MKLLRIWTFTAGQNYLMRKKLASLCANNLFLSSHITDAFRGIFRDRPRHKKFTLPMIHVYGFSKAEDPEFDLQEVCLLLLKLLLHQRSPPNKPQKNPQKREKAELFTFKLPCVVGWTLRVILSTHTNTATPNTYTWVLFGPSYAKLLNSRQVWCLNMYPFMMLMDEAWVGWSVSVGLLYPRFDLSNSYHLMCSFSG